MSVNVGDRLKYFRTQNKLTVSEMASKLGLSYGGYGKCERDERNPSLDVLIEMSKVLNVSTDMLLGLNDKHSDIQDEEWLLEIKYANDNKKIAMKNIWDQVKNL